MPQPTPSKTVLVVDDEMDMRVFISTVLKTSGYTPVATREGGAGIEKAKEIRPQAIVLDVMMPKEGGVTMYRELKSDPALKDIPVIMVSAVMEETFAHYLNMLNATLKEPIPHPSAYLEKPIDPEALLQQLERVLS